LFICIEAIAKIKKHLVKQKTFLYCIHFVLYWSVHLKHIFGDEDERWREEMLDDRIVWKRNELWNPYMCIIIIKKEILNGR